ncbi:MAG: UDP-glucose--hexose-1-phosphate uridylyltransferase [Salinivirgaceae bacterium]|nr:UDP-glucose--hexose-1-phosphate uridylyltransferase [Salinivirgaceae bacterium]
MDFTETTHRRFNQLNGEWVLVSPHRAKRPWLGQVEKTTPDNRPSYDPKCYLCPGNTRSEGAVNDNYTSTYVFTNDFSALLPNSETGVYKDNLLLAEAERGICKVICFSPNHSLTVPEMTVEAIAHVIQVWIEQFKELGSMNFINHIQIFENKGSIMGCSNPHPHGQIWAQSTVPVEVSKEQAHQQAYFDANGRTLLEDYVALELEKRERIVVENDTFVALVPFWATWPFETMILPKRAVQNITQLTDKEQVDFADCYKRLTVKYDNLFEVSFPYSAGVHQAPTDGANHPEWHLHMHFYPPLLRSATVKKFMVGYEMMANAQRDLTAEQAAARLKDLSEVHYKQKM